MKSLPFIPELLSDEENHCLYGGFSECLTGGGHTAAGTNDKELCGLVINWNCDARKDSVKGKSTPVKLVEFSFVLGDGNQEKGLRIVYDSAGVRKKLIVPLDGNTISSDK
ncbi:hypothetical protein FHS56_002153 [Thermonema lapsum]|uniref:Uncharacterized protein n=1 Tax=Thermonema lapsum TaxID=28195 RepID=A0A846MSM4_9BACT|nr:hypothetical protein [Thermonema lapsum]NIK74624.1 hypothetical protein [Thermonema lapsum]